MLFLHTGPTVLLGWLLQLDHSACESRSSTHVESWHCDHLPSLNLRLNTLWTCVFLGARCYLYSKLELSPELTSRRQKYQACLRCEEHLAWYYLPTKRATWKVWEDEGRFIKDSWRFKKSQEDSGNIWKDLRIFKTIKTPKTYRTVAQKRASSGLPNLEVDLNYI